jgi:hypothetical protein
MVLPIDRTAKATLDANLVNGTISDAPAIKASDDVVYNTIDELYNYSQGLVNAGILTQASQTPVANKIVQYDENANVVSALPVSNGQNPNLLFNPSFNLGASGWSGISANGFGISFSQSGEGSILSNGISAGGSGVQVDSTFIPSASGITYTISCEMFTGGVSAGGIQLQIFAYNGSTPISGTAVVSTNGQGWKRYNIKFTMPAGTTRFRVSPLILPNTTNTNAAWRKIKVESGSVSTTFGDDNTLNTQQYGGVLPLSQVLSGGNKMQSGTGSIVISTAGNQATTNVTFPVAFGTAPSAILITYQGHQVILIIFLTMDLGLPLVLHC